MKYDLSVEQKLLKDSAREFFDKEWNSTLAREMAQNNKGYDEGIWKKMAELGWMGLLIPGQYGDYEMTFMDMVVLLYEIGYACLPGPFFSSSVASVLAILEAGTDEQKQRLLPEVSRGKRIMTLAWTEPHGTYSPRGISTKARIQNGHYVVSGTKLFVPNANVADTIICVARTDEDKESSEEPIGLFIVDPKSKGLTVQLIDTLAGDKQCEVILDNVRIGPQDFLGKQNHCWPVLERVLQKASVAKCAEMSGGAQKALEMTVEHAKRRVQFGRPIGSFQAVQHMCADILTYVESSAFMTYQAAWKISEGLPFEKEASMSKAWVSDSYRKLVSLGHQIMGGTGFMEETDLQLYFKHAKTAELTFGDASFHRELVAQELGL